MSKFWTTFAFRGETDIAAKHCTHKYLGECDVEKIEYIVGVIDRYFQLVPFTPFSMNFDTKEWFGENNEVEVYTSSIDEVPGVFESLKIDLDTFRDDDYADYKPHVTTDSPFYGLIDRYLLMEGDTVYREWKTSYLKNSKQQIKELRPVKTPTKYWELMEARIRKIFLEEMYRPLIKSMDDQKIKLQNAEDDALTAAIKSGRISFNQGVFRGKFSGAISKELKGLGATFENGTYRLPLSRIPSSVKKAIELSEARFLRTLKKVDDALSQILPDEIAGKIKTADLFDKALFNVEADLNKTLKNITVPQNLDADQRAKIADEWSGNMDLDIKGFASDQIKELRETVRQAAYSGQRYESLIAGIQESYGVTQKKAKFLARQETNLLMSKFKETRYAKAGVYEYRWRCVRGSALHKVRPRHQALNDESTAGKIFRFDQPPVTTEPGEAERRNNPGEDYNCRCTAIAVVRF